MTRHRWIQHPITLELVPADEYVRPRVDLHSVVPDLEPFVSHVDGSVIRSRSQYREHNKRNDVVPYHEVSDEVDRKSREREDFYAGRPHDVKRRLDAIRFAFDLCQTGRTPADKKQMTENYRKRNA